MIQFSRKILFILFVREKFVLLLHSVCCSKYVDIQTQSKRERESEKERKRQREKNENKENRKKERGARVF